MLLALCNGVILLNKDTQFYQYDDQANLLSNLPLQLYNRKYIITLENTNTNRRKTRKEYLSQTSFDKPSRNK